jgi:hypothetical protein
VMPFLILSALLLIGVALLRRKWTLAVSWGLSLMMLGAALALTRWLQVQLQEMPDMPLTGTSLLLLTSVVTESGPRLVTLLSVLALGLPACLGLCHAAATAPRFWDKSLPLDKAELLRWSLILFSGTWFVWYLALAAAWTRYLVIPLYTSSIFVAATLVSLSDDKGLAGLFGRAAQALRKSTVNPRSVLALCLLLVLALTTAWTVGNFAGSYLAPADNSVEEVARYLNTRTAPNAVIESYEMELFPFLDRPYPYPPVASMEQLVRRNSRGEDIRVDYDPLQANPGYLVTGPVNALWGLYDKAIEDHEFELVWTDGQYRVYKRV